MELFLCLALSVCSFGTKVREPNRTLKRRTNDDVDSIRKADPAKGAFKVTYLKDDAMFRIFRHDIGLRLVTDSEMKKIQFRSCQVDQNGNFCWL